MPIAVCSTDPYVRTRTGVVVTATHPVIGPIYWEQVTEVSVGGPDYRSLSTSMERALLLEPGWREGSCNWVHSHHLNSVIRAEVSQATLHDEVDGDWVHTEFEGGLADLHAISGQTAEEFIAWLKAAEWVDAPGPTRIEHLIDHGYFSEWEIESQTMPA